MKTYSVETVIDPESSPITFTFTGSIDELKEIAYEQLKSWLKGKRPLARINATAATDEWKEEVYHFTLIADVIDDGLKMRATIRVVATPEK